MNIQKVKVFIQKALSVSKFKIFKILKVSIVSSKDIFYLNSKFSKILKFIPKDIFCLTF